LIRLLALTLLALECANAEPSSADTPQGIAPDIREDSTSLKLQRGNYVVVPIPISNPTLDTGLIAGAAYFWPQTAEQAARQPASVTGAAAMYTSNDSRVLVLAQQSYWDEDRWRLTGAIGAADLRLTLLTGDGAAGEARADWHIDGGFLAARLARKFAGRWYGGAVTRVVDAHQKFGLDDVATTDFDTGSDVRSVGIGLTLEYDSRDMPINSYSGRHLTADVLFNDEAIGSDSTYQAYQASFSSYHSLRDRLVLAWEVRACKRGAGVPLWDACRISLRGFPTTDYLGEFSSSAQLEVRWKTDGRFGLVAFGGAGYTADSFSEIREKEPIPSYGIGARFMVLQEKRINLRLDYARSVDSNAIHFSVGEAF
jgi:Omp85 superfamily domain